MGSLCLFLFYFLGLEIEFDCYERRPGQWTVRLEVPVDSPSGKPVFAEAVLTGKKRDAVNNCALEACKILDRYGMFQQSGNKAHLYPTGNECK